MALPYVSIKERRSPDDVLSYQHMNRLVDIANDSDALIEAQHKPGFSASAGRPPWRRSVTRPDRRALSGPSPGRDPHRSRCALFGWLHRSKEHRVGDPDGGPDHGIQHSILTFKAKGTDYILWAADVQCSFSGAPSTASGSPGQSNMLIIHPVVHVSVPATGDGASSVEVYFGPEYSTAFDGINKVPEIGIICHGYRRRET
jgi:hypothetical protein